MMFFRKRDWEFPMRTTPSMEEDMLVQKRELAGPGVGSIEIIGSWEDILKNRPFDIPYFTALNGRATLLLYISASQMADVATLEAMMRPGVNWGIHAQAFLRGSYPILRCHLMIPDNPRNPYISEVPLDVREGNVQEFCKAIFADEHVDMIVKHESRVDGHYLCAYQTPNLATILKKVVGEVVAKLKPTAANADFTASVRLMEQVFANAGDGLESDHIVPLIFAGKPKNELLQK